MKTYVRLVTFVFLCLFPSLAIAQTDMLDDFDREDGELGAGWSGSVAGYAITDEALHVEMGGDIYWTAEAFSEDQHVYVTLSAIDVEAEEIDLLLKSQSNLTWTEGVLEVWYFPEEERIQVVTFTQEDDWVQHGPDITAAFAEGDRFGAHARPDGVVEVYQNDDLLAVVDVSPWPFAETGGYVGLWMIEAGETVLDDFNGGDGAAAFMAEAALVPAPEATEEATLEATEEVTPEVTAEPTATPEPTVAPTSTTSPDAALALDNFNQSDGDLSTDWAGQSAGYTIVDGQVDVGDGGDIYWTTEAFGADQHVFVTLTAIDLEADEIDLLLKSQSNTTWGEGVIEVWYNPDEEWVRVVAFTVEDGWVQYGADIPVTFAEGDRFGARARPHGIVEVRQNGNLVASRDVSEWPHAKEGGYIGLWMVDADEMTFDDFGGGDW
jgi:hypothetical protein